MAPATGMSDPSLRAKSCSRVVSRAGPQTAVASGAPQEGGRAFYFAPASCNFCLLGEIMHVNLKNVSVG